MTKRVNTFTDAMRVESTRLTAPIVDAEVHHPSESDSEIEKVVRTASMKPKPIAEDASS